MNFNDYTKPQQRAIIEYGKNIEVSAGAGSGKTQVLTERFVHSVKNLNIKMDEFLVLTFTNLAAAEMKERIRKALNDEGFHKEATLVDTSDITTFDAYALSLVKKYHYLLKLSPNIKNVDSAIIEVKKRKELDTIFDEYYEKEDQDFLNLIKYYSFKDDNEVKELVLSIYKSAASSNDTEAFFNDFTIKYFSLDFIKSLISETYELIIKQVTKAKICFDQLSDMPNKKDESFKDLLREYYNFDKLPFSKNYNDLMENLSTCGTNSSLTAPNSRGYDLTNHEKELVGEIKDSLKKLVDGTKHYFKNEEEFISYYSSLKPFGETLIKIVKQLYKKIQDFKYEKQAFEFTDIAKMAILLLKDHDDIRLSIKNKLKMIMVDEYQDTSLSQDTLLEMIGNNNLYFVGDVKQSIYRFRGAKPELFMKRYKDYKDPSDTNSVAIDLNKNFRSRKEVLDDINYIFNQIMSEKCGGANYLKEHQILYGNSDYLKEGKGKSEQNYHVDFIKYPAGKTDENSKNEAILIARDIINKINEGFLVYDKNLKTLRKCCFSDFTIILDRTNRVDPYIKTFKEYGIPLYVERDESINQTDVVLMIVSLLKLIKAVQKDDYTSTEFKLAFHSFARSFVNSYSDSDLYRISKGTYFDDSIMQRLRKIVLSDQSESDYEIFMNAVYDFDIYRRIVLLGDVSKNELYLDAFVNYFKQMSDLSYTIDDFIEFMECINDDDKIDIKLPSIGSTLNSVKIIGIHKSKGLEYSIVYCANLSKQFNDSYRKESFVFNDKYGLIVPNENGQKALPNRDLYIENESGDSASEKIRLLYVQLTRTKEKMIFLIPDSSSANLLTKECLKVAKEFMNRDDFSIETAFNSYMNYEINYSTFSYIMEENGLKFGLDNVADLVERKNISFDTFIKRNGYIEPELQPYINMINETRYPGKLVLTLLNDYLKNGAIDLRTLLRTAVYFKKDLTTKGMQKAKDISFLTDKSKKFEYGHIKTLDAEQYNPNVLPSYKYQHILCNAISTFNKGDISDETLNLVFKACECEFSDDLKSIYTPGKTIPPYFDELPVCAHPIFEEETLDDFKKVLANFKKFRNFVNKEQQDKAIEIVFDKYPFNNEIHLALDKLYDGLLTKEDITFVLSLFKINVSSDFDKIMNSYKNHTISETDRIIIKSKNINDLLVINEESSNLLIDFDNNLFDKTIGELESLYKGNKITIEEFNRYLDVLNYQIDVDYLDYINDSSHGLKLEYGGAFTLYKHKGGYNLSFDKPKSSLDFIKNALTYEKATSYTYDLLIKGTPLNMDDEKIGYVNLDIKELDYQAKPIELRHASKELHLGADKKAMDYGTKLHFVMEITDLKNPDYSILEDDYQREAVKKFLSQDIMKDIKNGTAYKEYEFFDRENGVRGIIDLMVVYKDHIDIIDYKASNIDDLAYDEQLKSYGTYIEKTFHLPVTLTLYSLIKGTSRKVNK